MAHYKKLPQGLRKSLFSVPPSRNGGLEYRPCGVTTKDGRILECVYVVAADPYFRLWGVWPEEDCAKSSIAIESVRDIRESAMRLPPQFANELYAAGESGMGYCIFTVGFNDGTRQVYTTGNAVDFINYPAGKGPQDVVAVLPHEGGQETGRSRGAPDFLWCLYEGE